jgi:hypothetical protein
LFSGFNLNIAASAVTYFPAGYKFFPERLTGNGRHGSPEIWQELMFVAAI